MNWSYTFNKFIILAFLLYFKSIFNFYINVFHNNIL